MKRWLIMAVKSCLAGSVVTALALATLSGCTPVFLSEDVYRDAHAGLLPREAAPTDRDKLLEPPSSATAAPATVDHPDRKARPLNLYEAIAIALENGNVSAASAYNGSLSGTAVLPSNIGLSFSGATLNGQSERLRVLALGPAIQNAALEQSASRFDAIFHVGVNWTGVDGAAGIPNLPGTLQTTSLFEQPGQSARFESSIIKPMATGGVANISFFTDYRNLGSNAFLNAQGVNQAGVFGPFNPQYSPRLSFGFEQPLLRDAGVDINQLLARFPGITGFSMDPSASGALGNRQGQIGAFSDRNVEGILISRVRLDQQRAEFERNVHILMVNTEVAYWNLYNKYGQLYAIEENLRIMHKVWQDNYLRYKLGAQNPSIPQYQQILGQYHEFRGERLRALHEVLEAERNLRGILGMKVEDGERLVPITKPTLAKVSPDWESCLRDALALRPELVLARDNIRYHNYLLNIQENGLRPDLRFYARYEPFGDGSTLTGSGTVIDGTGTTQPTNAFRSLASGKLADWQVGLNMVIPLGYRAELASIRAARLELTQSYYVLRDQEDKAVRVLAEQYEQLAHWYTRIEAHKQERLGYLSAVQTRINLAKGDKVIVGDLDFLEAQRRYALALTKEYDAIAQYNATLAKLEWAKGTILNYNNVQISEGTLPQCAQVRAVEYEKERSKSIVCKESPDALRQPGRMVASKEADLPTVGDAPLEEVKTIKTDKLLPPGFEEKAKVEVRKVDPALTPVSNVEPIRYKAPAFEKWRSPVPQPAVAPISNVPPPVVAPTSNVPPTSNVAPTSNVPLPPLPVLELTPFPVLPPGTKQAGVPGVITDEPSIFRGVSAGAPQQAAPAFGPAVIAPQPVEFALPTSR